MGTVLETAGDYSSVFQVGGFVYLAGGTNVGIVESLSSTAITLGYPLTSAAFENAATSAVSIHKGHFTGASGTKTQYRVSFTHNPRTDGGSAPTPPPPTAGEMAQPFRQLLVPEPPPRTRMASSASHATVMCLRVMVKLPRPPTSWSCTPATPPGVLHVPATLSQTPTTRTPFVLPANAPAAVSVTQPPVCASASRGTPGTIAASRMLLPRNGCEMR